MATVIALALAILGQISFSSGVERSVRDKQFTRTYTVESKPLRVLHIDIKAATWKGNNLTKVSGTARVENEKSENIADGPLEIVDGWMVVRGTKGARFQYHPTDTGGELNRPGTPDARLPSGELAVVALDSSGGWVLEDDHFFFLLNNSFGADLDMASSFARKTRINLSPKSSVDFWGLTLVAGETGGSVDIVQGKPTGMLGVKAKTGSRNPKPSE